jgi:hypothetical protein
MSKSDLTEKNEEIGIQSQIYKSRILQDKVARGLAENLRSIIVLLLGHFIAEEQPNFVTQELLKFFGNTTK